LALDTSNYTTSVAVFDGLIGHNESRLLDVPAGELGLRQNQALFQHVKRLPQLFSALEEVGALGCIQAVGASTRPRAVEGSYMPCFLAGSSQGQSLARTLGVPFFAHSHQQGHLAAAAWAAGRPELMDRPFLAWHLSGGTTELLRVGPNGWSLEEEIVGGSTDISAGQLIDRTGVLLGLPFPAGKALDALYAQADRSLAYRVKAKELRFSLSGMENKVRELFDRGETPGSIARFTIDTLCGIVVRVTRQAQARWPGLPVLFTGGVSANSQLRACFSGDENVIFAPSNASTDNALGVAILTWRALHDTGGSQ
jgi:N6-L-threonylcarbamoyladenine synthase